MARRVTKHDFEILSNLVFDSFVSSEFEFQKYHFVLRTLTTEEREEISRKYKYRSNKYNIHLVLDILSNSILFIDGFKFIKSEHSYLLNKLNCRLILKLYEFYQKVETEVVEASKFVDYYVETRDSRNMWTVFKTCSRVVEPFSIRKFNQYQYYWIVMNSHKDSFEQEKRAWAKVEYMTNSICAFVNPKGYRKSKGQMGIVEKLEESEDKVKQQIVQEIENDVVKGEVDESGDVFSSLERMAGETEEEHEIRVNVLMEKTMHGEIVDEHERIVRQVEVEYFKKFLREKRVQVLVERELNKKKGIRFESTDILDNDFTRKQLEEDKKKGFFFEEYSYLDVVIMKEFAAIPKKDKLVVFDEVMSENVDVDKEVENFLKVLSMQSSGESVGLETQEVEQPHESIDSVEGGTRGTESDSSDVIRMAAERAAKMNVDVKGVDLMKQRQEKMKRANNAMQNRKVFIEPEEDVKGLDIMKFED